MLALMWICGEHSFIIREFGKEREAAHAIGRDAAAVDRRSAPDKLSEIVPIEVVAALEFPHQAFGIVDVARLVALVAGAYLLRDDFGEGKAVDVGGCERQVLEIALLDLPTALGRQGGRFAPADLELDLAGAAIPVVNVDGIDAPGQAAHRFVVALVRD